MRILIAFILSVFFSMPLYAAECVVLLHGLARTHSSMEKMEKSLREKGYVVANINYPSRDKAIKELANEAVAAGLQVCNAAQAAPINFVTHSLGGILVRQYYKEHLPEKIKRVVMLGPPNQGSQVVDNLKHVPGYKVVNGEAGMQLGTDDDSIPKYLGAVNFELGIIAGTKTFNPILSLFLPNPDDGKVSVENAKVDGMCGFLTLPVTHTFMMKNKDVIHETIQFLASGEFSDASAKIVCEFTQGNHE